MLEHFEKLGYKVSDPNFQPRSSDKHGFYKLQKRGKLYFAKYSKDDSIRPDSITVDIWWCKTVEKLRESHQLDIRTPRIIDHGTNWYILEWIEGNPSITPDDPVTLLDQYLDHYAHVLVELDSVNTKSIVGHGLDGSFMTPYEQLTRGMARWSKKAIKTGLLTSSHYDEARTLVDDHKHHIQTRFQHGDFVPWHFLIDNNKDWWLIDGEHASLQRARYYDLAYMYSRIFTRFHSPERAMKLVAAFLKQADITFDQIYPSFLPVIITRAIGMHYDAIRDVQDEDYRSDAQDLLKRCLSKNPDDLFTYI